MKVVQKSWGREEIIENGKYCCKKLVYDRPVSSSLHYHKDKHETFVVATGLYEIETGELGHKRYCMPGDFVVLVPGTWHRIRCVEAGFIVEASTPDNPDDVVRLVASES